jgi:hypothetical protein
MRTPVSRRALLSRLFVKLLRAHLALPAPGAGNAHPLEAAAIALLPVVVAHGTEPLRPVAALLALGLSPQHPALDDLGLPRCFGFETLQTPQDLAAQARLVLLDGTHQSGDTTLPGTLQAVQTLARALARAVTDPLRASALGFDADCFRKWVDWLESARRPSRLPAGLRNPADDSTANYLALDYLPRMKRWKDQHSALGGQKPKEAGDANADRSMGLAAALQKVLCEGAASARASVDLPVVHVRTGRLQTPQPGR